MGAYPALSIQPPENPIANISRLVALKGMLQQQQTQQQLAPVQLQEAQQAQQQQAIQLRDTQTLHDIAPKHVIQNPDGTTGYDWTGFLNDAGQAGIDPLKLQSIQKGIIDTQAAAAKLTADQRANHEAALTDGFNQLEGVRQIQDPAQQQQAYQSFLQSTKKAGLDTSQLPPQITDPKQFDLIQSLMGMHGQAIADAGKKAEISQNQAKAASEQATATKTGLESQGLQLTGGLTPPLLEAQYNQILQKQNQGLPLTPREIAAARAYEQAQQKTSTASDTLGITTSTTSGPSGFRGGAPRGTVAAPSGGGIAPTAGGAAPLSPTSTPAQTKESLVDMVGNYKLNPMMLSRLLTKHPDVIAQVGQKYPDFDQTTYNAKNALISKFTSGSESQQINAINTTAGHVNELYNAIDALNNGNPTILNKIGNAYNINVAGLTPQAVFKLIVHRVGPEIAASYIQGGGGEGERFAAAQDFNENLPPQTLKANAAETVKLLQSKIGSLANQYQQTVGRNDFQQRFITPAAQQAFQKIGGGGDGGSAAATPHTHVFSLSAWGRANPNGNLQAAKAAAQAAGYQVQP